MMFNKTFNLYIITHSLRATEHLRELHDDGGEGDVKLPRRFTTPLIRFGNAVMR